MQEAYGLHITPVTRSLTGFEDLLAAARSQLGEEAFAAAWAGGAAMPPERAI